ncbi:monofunctional biosynthetic peptidoglycan transglycosylase [Bosea vaviloviae]|uniref:Biosynthetic peptidoglycan transglycosylase n=2 Tax=Bosea vaviloviae TaxID=1526658 RepID=A0A1D7TVS2_9HYPH|nr:monofunctional biosynthetic peptidoglycan transglycosylase [Bosea vaviloviae]
MPEPAGTVKPRDSKRRGREGMAAGQRTARRGLFARLIRWIGRLVLGLLIVLALGLLLYRFIPAPSTLMIARWLSLQPVERQWVPLDQISSALIRSVIAAEDQRFCAHSGVDWIELNTVLDDEDGPSRGASTLTMQTAKNLFLWHGRSYIRKALEIPLALAIDLAWPKQRIIEVYLNIAEWGDGLFGAEAAAQRYFKKSAAGLTGPEASRLAAALPNPSARDPGRPSRSLQAGAVRVQRRLGQLGALGNCAVPEGEEDMD